MFTDDRFKTKYAVDKRGKPILESSSENLKKYYTLSKKERLREKRKNKKAELAKLLDIKKDEDADSNGNLAENLMKRKQLRQKIICRRRFPLMT